jgi:hypothetical protein
MMAGRSQSGRCTLRCKAGRGVNVSTRIDSFAGDWRMSTGSHCMCCKSGLPEADQDSKCHARRNADTHHFPWIITREVA